MFNVCCPMPDFEVQAYFGLAAISTLEEALLFFI
jgi:hypothetical protein